MVSETGKLRSLLTPFVLGGLATAVFVRIAESTQNAKTVAVVAWSCPILLLVVLWSVWNHTAGDVQVVVELSEMCAWALVPLLLFISFFSLSLQGSRSFLLATGIGTLVWLVGVASLL
jgi:hypothetical protein